MDIINFYYEKVKSARELYRKNHSESNRLNFENAQKNYHAILEGRENLI